MLGRCPLVLRVHARIAVTRKMKRDVLPHLDGENYFGVDKGKTGRFEAGGIFSAYYKTELLKNMFFENKLNLFQNYLEDPLNIDIDYLVSLEFTINRFLSTNILVHLLYDDNAAPEIQLKEVFGISFNVNF